MAPVIPSGSISLDSALGVGGFPRGQIVEIFGPASSGKTTLALEAVAGAQRLGGAAAFIDAERGFDPGYARRVGVDIENLLLSQPDCGDQALDIAVALAASRALDVIVVDSVAALVPREELAGRLGGDFFEFQDRLMSRGLRRLAGLTQRTGACAIFINQLRQRSEAAYGAPETTTGGNALKLRAAIRAEVRRVARVMHGGGTIGGRTRVRILKNTLAPPCRVAEFDILYGEGISREGDALDLGVMQGIVTRDGRGYRYGEWLVGRDREEARLNLRRQPAVFAALADDLRRVLGLPPAREQERKPAPPETAAAATP